MDNIKKHYEAFWEDKNESFDNYFRNNILKDFFNTGEKLLDVGCGDGTVGKFLQEKLGLDVSGIDISQDAVEKAKKNGIKAVVGNNEAKFPFKDASFDAVFWGDNIEHLFDPMFTAKEIKRILKPNGRLILSCPNMAYWRYRTHYFLKGALPDTEWTGHAPWNWSHIRFFNVEILENFFKAAGYKKIVRARGVSSRKIDKLLLPLSQTLFGMVLILEIE